MRYKTTIEIVAEAENKQEAMDIVGDYLSGDILSGVDMKCVTRPANLKRNVIAALVVLAVFGASLLSLIYVKAPHSILGNTAGINAVQPPLKTSGSTVANAEFKKVWEKEQTKKAINRIKDLR